MDYATKRAIDILFSLTIIIGFWWLLLGIALLVRRTSPGPAIFKQQRVGKNAAPFTCYKFRTMHQGVKQAGTHELTAAAVTKVGHLLRRTKLDELPQIINLLRGEMSLVGPRPCLPSQTELIEWRQRLGVYAVLPGITGLAQIGGIDMSTPEKLARMDAEYVATRTTLLDIKILLATALGSGAEDRIST